MLPFSIWTRVISFTNTQTFETLVNARPRFMMEMEPGVTHCADKLEWNPYSRKVPKPFVTPFCYVMARGIFGYLPPNLHTLSLGCSFEDQTIFAGIFPPALRVLRLGGPFNQRISPGVLPSSLRVLEFGSKFDQPISEGVLPQSLETLLFGGNFNQPLAAGVLPPSLRNLYFDNYQCRIGMGVLPPGLSTLRCPSGQIGTAILPKSLHTLEIRCIHNDPVLIDMLPRSLKALKLEFYNNQTLGKGSFPPSLRTLELGCDFNQPIVPGVLPRSLLTLAIVGQTFNHPIGIGVLPPNLHTLFVRAGFAHPIEDGVLPRSLRKIVVVPDLNEPHIFAHPETYLDGWRRKLASFLRDTPECQVEWLTILDLNLFRYPPTPTTPYFL